MGGFFGVASRKDCVKDLFYGTDYHSHLGTKRGGLAVQQEDGGVHRVIHSITNAQFRSKFDTDISDFKGKLGIGIISDYEDQPLLIGSRHGTYSIVTVGVINNLDELATRSQEEFNTHFCEMSNCEINPTELVASLINQKETIVEGIEYAQQEIEGSCSILIMTEEGIYAARDRVGRTPIILGKKDDGFAVTMETSAFPNLGYEIETYLGPSEIMFITPDKTEQLKAPGDEMKVCSFFWVYYGYPSSCYEGINAETMRYRNGELMAEDDDVDIDAVAGVPDSGTAHAIGYGNKSGCPYARPFVKYTPTWPRSFMPQNQTMRDLVANMKLIPVKEQIKDKRLLLCDDSIVRGTQLKDNAKLLYGAGAKEVHMRSACPPLMFGCKYLNFSRSRSILDLIARRAIKHIEGDENPDNLDEYLDSKSEKYQAMMEYICKELNLCSLKYQSLDKLIEAIGLPKDKVCTYCWDGKE